MIFGNALRTFIKKKTWSGHVTWVINWNLSLVHPLAGLQTRNRSLQSKKPVLFYPKTTIGSANIVENKNNYFAVSFACWSQIYEKINFFFEIICRLVYTEFLLDWFTAYHNLSSGSFSYTKSELYRKRLKGLYKLCKNILNLQPSVCTSLQPFWSHHETNNFVQQRNLGILQSFKLKI